jgi:acetolactate synthase I/II/III large subunit
MTDLPAAVGHELVLGGITAAFGVVGNGNIMAVTGLTGRGVRYVAARNEGGAIAMADAYHRVTGDVAVCTTTYGPGLTNAATGLAETVKHGSGVILLCGDRPVRGARPIDIDQAAFARSLGAKTIRLEEPACARQQTADALRLARTGPRPVVLSLPSDLLTAEVPDDAASSQPAAATRPGPDLDATEAALDAIAGARRPVLLAGLGARRSGAAAPVAALADRLGALLATTVMAAGLFDGNPWSVGICGGIASPRAAALIGDADVIVAFGTRLGEFALHGGRMLDPGALVIQVDIARKATADRVDVFVSGDAAEVARALLARVGARAAGSPGWRSQVVDDVSELGWQHVPFADASAAGRVDPRALSLALADMLPRSRTLVTDGGHFVGWPLMYWPVTDPAALVFTGAAFQSIGLGLGGAVGAAVGRPDRTTVVALGDGGALMGLPELETLIRVAGSALVVIYNDAAYGAERHLYGSLGADLSVAEFADTDFAALARALGADGATVRTVGDLEVLRSWLNRGCPGTFVLDCKVVPGVVAPYLADFGGRIRSGGV